MTVSHRKSKPVAQAEESKVAEPGTRYHCDVCAADITLTVRIRCAEGCEDFDLCGSCFCNGAELGKHKASHAYRVVQQASYPIFCDEWGADEELLLLDGCQIYGLGNWSDIADHIGNRTKEEVEEHYQSVFVEGKDGTLSGENRAKKEELRLLEEQKLNFTSTTIPGSMSSKSLYVRADVPIDPLTGKSRVPLPPNVNKPGSKPPASGGQLPVVGPNLNFNPSIDADEFQKRKRRRIDTIRDENASNVAKAKAATAAAAAATANGTPVPAVSTPKPLVSAPTSHSELAGYMPGRLEFEYEYEQEAETLVKDMEFGKIYQWGGEEIPGDEILLEDKKKGKQKEVEEETGGDVEMKDGGKKPTDGNEATHPALAASSRSAAPPPGAASEGSVVAAATSSTEDPSSSATAAAPTSASAEPPTSQHPNPAAPLADPDDKAPDWDEDLADLKLKLEILDMYNERLDRRARRKDFVLERRLTEMKRNQAQEKRRPKDERDLLSRVKHFAQMQNAMNFEDFFNGLVHEEALRRAASQLQACRKVGLTSLSEVAQYEAERVDRAKRAAALAEGGFAAAGYGLGGYPGASQASGSGPRAGAGTAKARGRETSGTPQAEDPTSSQAAQQPSTAHKRRASNAEGPKTPRKPPRPLDISHHDSLRHLTPKEQVCCSEQRILPNSFLVMKKEIIVEYLRRDGVLTRRDARTLFKMDVNKVGKVYDLLSEEGYLLAASKGWDPKDGIGVPPGHEDENSLGKTGALQALLKNAAGAVSPMTATTAKALDLKFKAQQEISAEAKNKGKEDLENGVSKVQRERTTSSPLTQAPLNASPIKSPVNSNKQVQRQGFQPQHQLSQSHLPNDSQENLASNPNFNLNGNGSIGEKQHQAGSPPQVTAAP